MTVPPDAGPDDVPAEVPDYIPPGTAVVEPTPLDEDTSEDDPDAEDEIDDVLDSYALLDPS